MFKKRYHKNRKNNDMELVSNSSLIWKLYKKNTFDVIGLYVFILLIIIIYLIPLIINADGYTINQEIRLLPPSWKENGNLMHFLGTDEYGRDFLSRMLEAEQKTINTAFYSALIASIIGLVVGTISALNKKNRKHVIIHHVFDIFLSIPSILIAIVITAILGPSLKHAILAISLSLLPRFIKAIFNAVKDEYSKPYINNNIQDGFSNFYILTKTVVPNIVGPYINVFLKSFVIAILDITSIGFLGLGAQEPVPCIGSLMSGYLDYLFIGIEQALFPGIILISFIISIRLINHGLNRVFDIKMD